MIEVATTVPSREDSPRSLARWIGGLTLLTVMGGVFAEGYVAKTLIAWRDATATASNIVAHRDLYQAAVAVYLVEMACSIATAALFYVLLKPAGRSLSLVTLCLGLVANALKAGARVLFAAPLYVLGATRFHALGPETLTDLSLLLLLINNRAAGIAMVFFGFQFLLRARLMSRSTFLPRFLSIMALIAGLAWLTSLWPPLRQRLGDVPLMVGLLCVLVETFWLLVFGVNEQRWREQASSNRL
jgi:hypothetical protein